MLGTHVYDPSHYKVMTIIVCDMKSKMAAHEKQMWQSLLVILKKHGITTMKFKGFMADSAHNNFKAMQEIFNFRDKIQPMVGQKRKC